MTSSATAHATSTTTARGAAIGSKKKKGRSKAGAAAAAAGIPDVICWAFRTCRRLHGQPQARRSAEEVLSHRHRLRLPRDLGRSAADRARLLDAHAAGDAGLGARRRARGGAGGDARGEFGHVGAASAAGSPVP